MRCFSKSQARSRGNSSTRILARLSPLARENVRKWSAAISLNLHTGEVVEMMGRGGEGRGGEGRGGEGRAGQGRAGEGRGWSQWEDVGGVECESQWKDVGGSGV